MTMDTKHIRPCHNFVASRRPFPLSLSLVTKHKFETSWAFVRRGVHVIKVSRAPPTKDKILLTHAGVRLCLFFMRAPVAKFSGRVREQVDIQGRARNHAKTYLNFEWNFPSLFLFTRARCVSFQILRRLQKRERLFSVWIRVCSVRRRPPTLTLIASRLLLCGIDFVYTRSHSPFHTYTDPSTAQRAEREFFACDVTPQFSTTTLALSVYSLAQLTALLKMRMNYTRSAMQINNYWPAGELLGRFLFDNCKLGTLFLDNWIFYFVPIVHRRLSAKS
jgi:hypothetical protein